MFEKMNSREKKTVLLCAAGAGLIVGWFLVAEPLLKNWKDTRTRLAALRGQLRMMEIRPQSKEAIELEQLVRAVPVVEMPERAEVRGPAFQEEFTKQLRKAGLNSRRLQLSAAPGGKGLAGGYRVLRLESQGRGDYGQVLKLLSDLPSNPMYAGVQRLRLQPDAKDRKQMDWELTVFAYAR